MNNKLITSMQNSLIKNIILLQKKKSARKKQGLFVVEGIRSVSEVPSDYIEYYVTTEEMDEKTLPGLKNGKWIVVTAEIYKAISETESPQGAMAVVRMPDRKLADLNIKKEGTYILLENLQDPGNLGTIVRSAHAFNISGIFLTKGSVDLYSPKVVRSTMGSLFHVPIVCDEEAENYVSYLKNAGVKLYTTALTADARPVYETDFKLPLAIAIGNEGNGLTEAVKSHTDCNMLIPMPGGSESLNASVASSICMYELLRRGLTTR